jgi:phenylalanyl-tRNA synthetase beta chain
MCAICDDDGVLGLGGVMGGLASGCTPETTNVFVEAALFDPRRTAATGRRLGILSDARYRFERGVDPAFVGPGLEVATRLFLELCGGAHSAPVTAGAVPPWRRQVDFRPHRVESLGGLSLPEAETEALLRNLGFAVAATGGEWTVEPPSWRPDIDGEADLVEEVLRLRGYDAIPPAVLPALMPVARPAIDAGQRRVSAVRRAQAARGLVEAVTYSFVSRRHATLFGGGADGLVLANPISPDLDTLRPTPLPALVAAMKRNRDRGQGDGALFEIGPAYGDDGGEAQAVVAAALRAGMSGPRHWNEKPRPVDAFDAKADAMAALAACGIVADQLQVAAGNAGAASWYHPGRSGTLSLGPKPVLAQFGEVHPAVLAAFDLKGPLVACEVFLDRLPPAKAKTTKARPPLAASDLPAVERDFAFVVDSGVAADALVRAARAADRAHVAHVGIFDLFEGQALGPGKKSLALAVRLQPKDKTFTDAEVAAIGAKIVAAVAKATGGSLRG